MVEVKEVIENITRRLRRGYAEKLSKGRIVKGTIIGFDSDQALINVGHHWEGRIPLRELAAPGGKVELKAGDEIEFYVDEGENQEGGAMLSPIGTLREAAWDTLEAEYAAGNQVEGVIVGRVKGGFSVDLGGPVAFLPRSQVDVGLVRNVTRLMDVPQPFQILKMDRRRGNIVVSRRAALEKARAEQSSGLIQSLTEGQVVDGVVKKITHYGAFVDLGGIEGLLHIKDLSSKRIDHPSDVLEVGDPVKVEIIRINRETQRISLRLRKIESLGPQPHEIPTAFVLEGAQTLLNSLQDQAELCSLLAALTSWEDAGSAAWLGALRALYREGDRPAADRLAQTIHQVLITTEHHDLVPELFLAQAAAYDGLGDNVARDLFAIEAAEGFMELRNFAAAATALHRARC